VELGRGLGVSKLPSGGGVPSFESISGKILWLDAEKQVNGGSPANDDPVNRWDDLSSQSNSWEQTTFLNQPIWKMEGFGTNNKPYIQFDGVNDFLEWVFPYNGLVVPYTAFIVQQKLDVTNTTSLQLATLHDIWTISANRFYVSFASGDVDISPSAPTSTANPHLFDWVQKVGTQTSANYNGNFLFNLNPNAGKPIIGGQKYIGRRSGGAWSNFNLSELIIYNRALTPEEIGVVQTHFNDKYQLY
jgi:hypothetical protein